MHIQVNGVKLFFDVEGAKLVPDGPVMREKPTLLLLHGGPGFDHASFKPFYSPLSEVAQLVYLEHRGNGRSDGGPTEKWNLAQWGDDIAAFCDALGIIKPIVLGVSFGGMVTMSYATRHPDHPAKIILITTMASGNAHRDRAVALFEKLGGPEVGALARRRFLEGRGQVDRADLDKWRTLAMPHYQRRPRDPGLVARTVSRLEVLQHFTKPGGEGLTFDILDDLKRIKCPTLVLGGDDDPMTPIECQIDIANAIPKHLVQFERWADCGHGVVPDVGEPALKVIRDFVTR
jgi:pimeloyl-ACP methyl ester carboxylesterase